MTTVALTGPVPMPRVSPWLPTPALLAAGAVAVLVGAPEWGLAPVGVLMLWGIHEAGRRSASRRVGGHAATLVALAFVLGVATPVFLPAALDQLTLTVLVAAALVAVICSAPTVRAVLRPRRTAVGDVIWLLGAFGSSLVVGASVGATDEVRTTDAEQAAITGLVLLVPAVHELLLRGLLLHAMGRTLRGVALVAAVQGLVMVPFFGWAGLLAGTCLGLVLGLVHLRGGWQSALSAHWGLALGVATPILTVAG
jgi:membrane protease YdiL (CAAX protease family)